MKFTLSWLKDHLDTTASLDTISKTLTSIGLEVESITDPAASLAGFTVAKILEATRHPEADKLQVCKVESDAGILQIVCGAPNARAGLNVVLAKEGAHIPGNGMVIKKTKIRGVESNGMLCSASELGLSAESEGIIELPESATIGQPAAEALGASDPIIEIAITPNRADCLGVYGIARDLAAAGLGILLPLPNPLPKGEGTSPITVSITTANCPEFIGCTIKGVKNGPSPDWLRKRLEAIGQKSISTLVDITNLLTFDLARPLHVFDAKKLKGNIVARDAKDGEKLKALNGKEYELTSGMCVIADDSGPVGLAGVIGGEATSCDENTTDVFLEVATFNPVSIAKTGRALDILSDARFRFERGIDPAFLETGAKIAIDLIVQLCGGTASELTRAGKSPDWKRSIAFTPERVKTLGGVDISAEKSKQILTSLGFTLNGTTAQPPSWRADVEGEADLVEEILRIHGYDHIPATPLPASHTKPAPTQTQTRSRIATRTLVNRGMLECVTWSFLPEAQAQQFGGTNPKLKLLNPISADLDTMRPSLLPNLLDAAKRNANRGFKDNALCEVGLQFHDITPDGQKLVVCGLRTGMKIDNEYNFNVTGLSGVTYNSICPDGFRSTRHVLNAFDAKADALSVLAALGVTKYDITTNTPNYYHPCRSGALTLGGKIILGYFGEIHPGLLRAFDMDRTVGFEIFLDALPASRAKGTAKPKLKLSDFQAVERDFAFIVDTKISAGEIIKSLAQADKQLITDVSIFDVYTGKGVDAGKKSVAIKVTLQSFERTLTDADITAVSAAIIAAAAKHFGGQLRQ